MRYWKQKMMGVMLTVVFLCTTLVSFPIKAEELKTEDLELTLIGEATVQNGRRIIEYEDNSLLQPEIKNSRKRSSNLPVKYTTKHTSVKNQGNTGTCWSFGALASLESGMMVAGNASSEIDLSEWHLVYYSYHGQNENNDKSRYAGYDSFINNSEKYDDYHVGGSRMISAPTLFRWYGAVSDTVLPFSEIGQFTPSESKRTNSEVHLEDAVYLPEINQSNGSQSKEAVQAIKQALFDTGAVSAGYYSSSNSDYKYDNTDGTTSYYYNGTEYPDHEITIVGWDDNYSKENFNKTPEGDGAFLVKNSWGTSWGDNGYFYLSYYDTTLSEPTVYEAENMEYKQNSNKHVYQNIYQYDGAGFGDAMFTSNKSIIGINRYTARNNEKAEAYGTYVPAANSIIKVRIYRSKDNRLMAEKDSSVLNAGYYTIPLGNASFDMKKGEEYKVEVQISYKEGADTIYYYPFEVKDTTDDDFNMDCAVNQTEISNEFGVAGTDVMSLELVGNNFKFGNALIKLYSNDGVDSSSATTAQSTTTVPGTTAQPKPSISTPATTAQPKPSTSTPGTTAQPTTTAKPKVTYIKPYFTKSSLNIYKGNKATLAVKNKVSGAKVTFSSSKNSVAAVNSKGTVTGKKAGSATITAKVTQQGKSYSLKCKVKVSNKRLAFTKKKAKIKKKKSYTFKVKKYGVTGKVKWKVSNKKLASIGKTSGKFKAKKKKGKVKVTAYCGKFKVSYTVKIY